MRKLKMPKFVRKHKSDIMFFGGIGLIVAGTVGACVATFKAKDAIEELNDEIEEIHKEKEKLEPAEYRGKVAHTYFRVVPKIALMYAGPVACHIAGIKMITKVHTEQKETIADLGAALSTSIKDFKDYRKRVVLKEGEEADRRYRFGIEDTEVEETDENGDVTVKSLPVIKNGPNECSIYAKFFDSGCYAWTKDPEENLAYLKAAQSILTDKLRHDGYLFLNDVYEHLGIAKTAIGQQVGWCYGLGDDYVDFGLYNVYREPDNVDQAKINFINGYEPVVLLDFNLDGPIVDIFHKYARR